MTPQPYIGMIVHYVSLGSAGGQFEKEHRAAIITELSSNPQQVSLCVLNPNGFYFLQNALHSHPDTYQGGTWHFMSEDEKKAVAEGTAGEIEPAFD